MEKDVNWDAQVHPISRSEAEKALSIVNQKIYAISE